MGSRPAKSATKSKRPLLDGGLEVLDGQRAGSSASSSATRRAVKALDTSERIRVWRGGSMARNDMARWASGP